MSGGRGAGSAEGFAAIEELAGLLGGAVGCSRAVTIAGWRPHTDQVGQTGTKIAPEIYIPCGISGATQHMAGCKGAKRILAINTDPEAPIIANADYAVIGDLHEVVPGDRRRDPEGEGRIDPVALARPARRCWRSAEGCSRGARSSSSRLVKMGRPERPLGRASGPGAQRGRDRARPAQAAPAARARA